MVAMVTVATKMDWAGWLRGLVGSAVSGGAGAIGTGFGTIVVDPEHFNFNASGGFHHLLSVMGITFAFSALISLAKYLQTHPVPDVSSAPAPPPVQ